jgi:hypothetical protein
MQLSSSAIAATGRRTRPLLKLITEPRAAVQFSHAAAEVVRGGSKRPGVGDAVSAACGDGDQVSLLAQHLSHPQADPRGAAGDQGSARRLARLSH